MIYPDFKIQIEDRWVADFWLNEWWRRYYKTKDLAFREQANAMQRYIDRNFDEFGELEDA